MACSEYSVNLDQPYGNLMAGLYDILFRFSSQCFLLFFKFIAPLLSIKKNSRVNRILVLPYYPETIPGAKERMVNWKDLFKEKGIVFQVSWASNENDFKAIRGKTSAYSRYLVFFKMLLKRSKIIPQLRFYDAIWIQRAFVPFYPYRNAYFETFINKLHPNVIMDFYDADYVHNESLTNDSARLANKITVSTPYLKQYFETINVATHLINMTIPECKIRGNEKTKNNSPVIGWMGSGSNFKHIEKLANVLKKIRSNHEDVSIQLVCPKDKRLGIEGITYYNWEDVDFDYKKWLSAVDIGIVPFFGKAETEEAKSPMKTLEFMSSETAIVGNTNSIYQGMESKKHFILAESESEWYSGLEQLIKNKVLRDELSKNSLEFFLHNHTYEANFERLYDVLCKP